MSNTVKNYDCRIFIAMNGDGFLFFSDDAIKTNIPDYSLNKETGYFELITR